MAHAQKPDIIFRRNGRVHLNQRGRQFSRLLAAEVCASAVVMLDTLCSEVVWKVLATHSIRQFPPHFPSPASPVPSGFNWTLPEYQRFGGTCFLHNHSTVYNTTRHHIPDDHCVECTVLDSIRFANLGFVSEAEISLAWTCFFF